MKFLIDQDVYAATTLVLRNLGHDVATAAELGHAQSSVAVLLRIAQEGNSILVTRDRDFGGLVFVQRLLVGVIYLRVLPSTLSAGHQELEHVLASYPEEELKRAFVVVEPGRHRFRRLPA